LLVEKTQNNYDPDNPYIHRQCVESCNTVSGYKTFLNRCVQTNKGEVTSENLLSRTGLVNYFQDVSEDLSECWREIIYVCIISFAFSFIVLVLFRFVVGFVVWIVLFASIVVSLIATIFLWVKYAQYKKDPDSEKVMTYLVSAIIATCITVVILFMLLIMRKRIKLVVELFKEAGKALSDMPVLLFEPLLVNNHA
jgi:solute carrier family 44 protein 1 (choline transporter-like protein)